jgi:hypothetical protein
MTLSQEWLRQVKVLLDQEGISVQESNKDHEEIYFGWGEVCALQLGGNGVLTCSFKVDLEEIRTLISDDTTEDLSEDELCRVAREELRPVVDRYRWEFRKAGFEEAIESDHNQYAIVFTRSLMGTTPQEARDVLKWCQQSLRGN